MNTRVEIKAKLKINFQNPRGSELVILKVEYGDFGIRKFVLAGDGEWEAVPEGAAYPVNLVNLYVFDSWSETIP